MEKHWHQNVPVFSPNSSVETDSFSVMVHSDEDLVSDSKGLDTALKPPVRANEPPIRANEPPTEVSEPQSGANKPPDEAVKRPNAPNVSANAGDLYDPHSQHPSWEPKADFTAFLEKHFHRKLSYDQVSDILDSSDFSLTLDNSVLNQMSPLKSRKYTQERDKELASVQRSMLNTTGPLCCLHDALCSDQDVSKDDINSILEQSLCLLGSANFLFSALRRRKILVAMNKDKIGLVDQPLPNAKRLPFGDDFPSIASKQAHLSRGLEKNLRAASHPARRPPSGSSRPPNKADKPFAGSYSRYHNRLKKPAFLSCPQTGGKRIDSFIDNWRAITSDPDILSIGLCYKIPLRCKPVQPSKCRPHRFRDGEPPHQGGHCRNFPPKEKVSSVACS